MTATLDLEPLRGHTPGPWYAVQLQSSVRICTAEDGGYSERVAECCHWSQPAYGQPDRATALANANLIAAAPALLAELTTRRARDAEVEALVGAAKRANGDHSAPRDCYATGPLTGDDHLDLVSCPGCELAAALTNLTGATS